MTTFVRHRGLADYQPSPEALADAPLLQRWHLEDERSGDGAALLGVRASDRARIETATVQAIDPVEGWAMTHAGGLWRLNGPLDSTRRRHHSLLCWRPETIAKIEGVGFGLPPAELVPVRDLYDDVSGWRRLAEWYDGRQAIGEDEFLIYLALRTGGTPLDAYMYSDSFAKDRFGVRGYN